MGCEFLSPPSKFENELKLYNDVKIYRSDPFMDSSENGLARCGFFFVALA
jgi:hypothetical protein